MDDRHDIGEITPSDQLKKAYQSPKLEVYGVVSDIAASGGTASKDTGAKKG